MEGLEQDLRKLKLQEKTIKKKMFKNNNNGVLKKLKKYLKPYEADSSMRVLPIKYKGKNVLQITVADDKYKSKGYTRAKMQRIGNELSTQLEEFGVNGLLWTTLKFDQYYRSARPNVIGETANLYNVGEYDGDENDRLAEQKYFKKVIFYIGETPNNPVGGNDNKYNDCLFMCLHYALLNENPFKTAKRLKDYLGLGRSDFVHIDDIQKIEVKLKNIKINVSGDYIYSSTLINQRTIHLKLIKNHYTLDHALNTKVHHVSYSEKKTVINDKVNKLLYDGISITPYDKSTITLLEDTKYFKTDYIIIPKATKETVQEEYNKFIKVADRLKEISKGVINLYKTGTIKQTALYLFDKFTKTILTPDSIEQDEAIWLIESTLGAIIFFEEYKGEGWKYDVKSMYPSIQTSTKLCIPVKRGEFTIMSDNQFNELNFFPYGIYKCKILKSENKDINKLFRFSTKNKYSHIDLTNAKKLNLDIQLIQDGKANVLLYSRDKLITAYELFNKYIDFLFPLKETYKEELPEIKRIINILWGALSETLTKRKIVENNSILDYDIPDDSNIDIIKPTMDGKGTIVDVVENNYYFKSNFARIKPFLLSKGRLIISDIMYPFKENVVRCHTDGIVLNKKCDIKTGDKLGDLTFEAYSSCCNIESNAKPKGFEKV